MLWPARPKPLAGETPASWFVRVAYANGHGPLELVRILCLQASTLQHGNVEAEGYFSLRALDKGSSGAEAMRILAKATGVAVRVIDEMIRATTHIEELNNLMLATHDSVWRFCPRCLQDDPVPYFRLDWRKGWHLLCPVHLVWLEDRCKHCEAHVDLDLYGPDSASLAVCATCGDCLGSQNIVDINERVRFLDRQRRFGACLLRASRAESGPMSVAVGRSAPSVNNRPVSVLEVANLDDHAGD